MKEKTHIYEVAKKVVDTKASTIIPIIRHFVADGSTVVTDESSIYNGLSEYYNHLSQRESSPMKSGNMQIHSRISLTMK